MQEITRIPAQLTEQRPSDTGFLEQLTIWTRFPSTNPRHATAAAYGPPIFQATVISAADAGSGWKIGGGRRSMTCVPETSACLTAPAA